MISTNDKLVRMANQIAAFFRTYPEQEAIAGVQHHLVAFWTPKMRASLTAYAEEIGDRLDPLAVKALARGDEPIGRPRNEMACDAG